MADKSKKALRYAFYTSMMVYGVCLVLTSTLRACNQKKQNHDTTQAQTQIVSEDAFILANDEDYTLHRGSIIKTTNGDYVLTFNCGEVLSTNKFKAYTKEPSSEAYTQKCDKCFEHEEERTL